MTNTYTGIDDPLLEVQAKINLRARYPELTDHDLELLWGSEAKLLISEPGDQGHTG